LAEFALLLHSATPAEKQQRCARIRFRAHAALHKPGAKDN